VTIRDSSAASLKGATGPVIRSRAASKAPWAACGVTWIVRQPMRRAHGHPTSFLTGRRAVSEGLLAQADARTEAAARHYRSVVTLLLLAVIVGGIFPKSFKEFLANPIGKPAATQKAGKVSHAKKREPQGSGRETRQSRREPRPILPRKSKAVPRTDLA